MSNLGSGPVINPIVAPTTPTPSINPSTASLIQQAIALVQAGLPGARTIAQTDKDKIYFLLGALQLPFDGAGLITADIFTPPPLTSTSSQSTSFAQSIADAISQISNVLNNPLSGVLGKKGILGASSVADLTSFSDQVANADYDQSQMALQSFFALGPTSQSNLAALLLYSIEHALPYSQILRDYLHKLEALVSKVLESMSELPAVPIPELSTLLVAKDLCDAGNKLDSVLAELSQYQILDRSTLANATAHICRSASILSTGQIPAELLPVLQQLFGLSDLQTKIIADSSFTTDPELQLALSQINTLSGFVYNGGQTLEALNANLLALTTTLSSIQEVSIQSIMSTMISTIRGQIANIQAGLQAQVTNFVRQYGKTVSTSLAGTTKASLYSTPIDTAQLYTSLAALCSTLGSVSSMYQNMVNVLTQDSPMLRAVNKFVTKYNVNLSAAPDVTSTSLALSVQNFAAAANARITGQTTTNDAVMTSGQAVLAQSKQYRKFMGTLANSLAQGQAAMIKAFDSTPTPTPTVFPTFPPVINPGPGPTPITPPDPTPLPTSPSAATSSIQDLTRFLPDLETALRTLDLKRIIGGSNADPVEGTEYTALNQIQDGLAQLSKYCNNAYTRNVANLFDVVFHDELARRQSVAVTESAFDEVPAIAWQANVDYRVTTTNNYLNALQTFINNPNLATSCSPTNSIAITSDSAVLVSPSSLTPTIAPSKTTSITPLGAST